MVEHTQGPWVLNIEPGMGPEGEPYFYVDCEQGAMKHLPRCTSVVDPEMGIMNEADARLIAAAPDLLAIVRERLESCNTHDADDIEHEWAKKARAAVAKATNG